MSSSYALDAAGDGVHADANRRRAGWLSLAVCVASALVILVVDRQHYHFETAIPGHNSTFPRIEPILQSLAWLVGMSGAVVLLVVGCTASRLPVAVRTLVAGGAGCIVVGYLAAYAVLAQAAANMRPDRWPNSALALGLLVVLGAGLAASGLRKFARS